MESVCITISKLYDPFFWNFDVLYFTITINSSLEKIIDCKTHTYTYEEASSVLESDYLITD